MEERCKPWFRLGVFGKILHTQWPDNLHKEEKEGKKSGWKNMALRADLLIPAYSGWWEVFRQSPSEFLPVVCIICTVNHLPAYFQEGKTMDNVYKLGYIECVSFQIKNIHSISKSYNQYVCKRHFCSSHRCSMEIGTIPRLPGQYFTTTTCTVLFKNKKIPWKRKTKSSRSKIH